MMRWAGKNQVIEDYWTAVPATATMIYDAAGNVQSQ
jgi:hypothetical protein